MSFESANFSPIGGQARSGNSPAQWSYRSSTDMLSMVQALGYFDEIGTQVSPGDFISVSLMDGKAILTVLSVTLTPPGVVIDAAIIGAGGGGVFPIMVEATDTLLLEVDDNETFFVMVFGFQQDVFIPENSSQPFPIGAEMVFLREGTGAVMFHISGSAVLQSRDGLVMINARYSAATLKKIGLDEWRLIGDLA